MGWTLQRGTFLRIMLSLRSPLVSQARLLGFNIGRGDTQLDLYATQRMEAQWERMRGSKLGISGNSVLVRSCILSVATHVLRAFALSPTMAKLWTRIYEAVYTSPTNWFKPFAAHARGLFGFPVDSMPLAYVLSSSYSPPD